MELILKSVLAFIAGALAGLLFQRIARHHRRRCAARESEKREQQQMLNRIRGDAA